MYGNLLRGNTELGLQLTNQIDLAGHACLQRLAPLTNPRHLARKRPFVGSLVSRATPTASGRHVISGVGLPLTGHAGNPAAVPTALLHVLGAPAPGSRVGTRGPRISAPDAPARRRRQGDTLCTPQPLKLCVRRLAALRVPATHGVTASSHATREPLRSVGRATTPHAIHAMLRAEAANHGDPAFARRTRSPSYDGPYRAPGRPRRSPGARRSHQPHAERSSRRRRARKRRAARRRARQRSVDRSPSSRPAR